MKAEIRNIDLIKEIDPLISKQFYTDPRRLKQILINLVSNALKFTFRGYIRITAIVVSNKDNQLIEIAVEDTGIGIKKKDTEKLFKMFSMISEAQSVNKTGTGMGLYISKSLSTYLSQKGDNGI